MLNNSYNIVHCVNYYFLDSYLKKDFSVQFMIHLAHIFFNFEIFFSIFVTCFLITVLVFCYHDDEQRLKILNGHIIQWNKQTSLELM